MLLFLLSLLEGDPEGSQKVEYIYNHFHDDMVRLAQIRLSLYRIPPSEWDAEDIVQESFLRITKYIHCFDLSLGDERIKSYTLMVVINVIRDVAKKRKPTDNIDDHEFELFDDSSDFIEEFRQKEEYNRVVDAIEHLSDIYRIVFTYRYMQGISVREMAVILGIPQKTVETRLTRGKAQLKELLEK